MIGKIVKWIVLLPIAILVILFAVANRQVVTVSLDPFGEAQPGLSLTAPLFIVVLLCLLAGVVVGGAAAWMRQSKWRRAARRYEGEARALAGELRAFQERRGAPPLPPFDAARTPPLR